LAAEPPLVDPPANMTVIEEIVEPAGGLSAADRFGQAARSDTAERTATTRKPPSLGPADIFRFC